MIPSDDPERDAWLREALRHAPDADAAPPAALSAAILQRAHAAAARPRTRWTGRALAVWGWLGSPAVAGGFASVLLATMVGLMWWPHSVEEAARREAAAPQSEPVRVPAEGAVAEGPLAEAPRQEAPLAQASPAARPPPSPRPAIAPPSPAQPRSASVSTAAKRAAQPSEGGAESQDLAQAPRQEARNETLRDAAGPVVAAASPSGGTGLEPPSPREERMRGRADSAAEQAQRKSATAVASDAQVGPVAPAARALGQGGSGSAGLLTGQPPAPGPWAALAPLQLEPQQWAWQATGRERKPVSEAFLNWLARFDSATRGRWEPVAPHRASSALARTGASGSAMPPSPVTEIDLLRDGSLRARLSLDADKLRLLVIDERAVRPPGSYVAIVPPALAVELRDQLLRIDR